MQTNWSRLKSRALSLSNISLEFLITQNRCLLLLPYFIKPQVETRRPGEIQTPGINSPTKVLGQGRY